mmetsp:Transcript_14870/g.34538  ORF Transcript_14870/g.34538 Transcript_14870/m.34538 type:complete len:1602 (-) Transcript_14870:1429-6234(-)|eukprot:CAMPEP_0197181684 /NCGR_PEP_ID=MMETSP1423-20130617/5894_1 /TAXON_ID=476441 /ORGANISM="Pseudo-nitzschia heimii, Strain UNC1101" /LENGTH=1601 /DNA_ID=CAMNT_0042631979 /DNA_START=98 /DNA_END=4903 /DNA_ORIENTATION=-
MPSSSANNGGGHCVMDFSTLLSRGYRPAHLSRITPKERPKDFLKKDNHNNHHHHDNNEKSKQNFEDRQRNSTLNTDEGDKNGNLGVSIGTTAGVSEDRFVEKLEREEKANQLVFQLVSKTPVYREHLTRDDDNDPKADTVARLEWLTKTMGDDIDLKDYAPKLKWVSPLASALSLASNAGDNAAASTVTIEELSEEDVDVDAGNKQSVPNGSSESNKDQEAKNISKIKTITSTKNCSEKKKKKNPFSSLFHQVELGDWESMIEWEGYKDPHPNQNYNGTTTNDAIVNMNRSNSSSMSNAVSGGNNHSTNSNTKDVDAMSLLQKRRNPFLENISFDKLISWTGDPEEALEKARSEPLILELGVAGRSVAKYVLPNHRPLPYAKSDPYQARLELGDAKSKVATSKGAVRSTAELNRGTLHADKEEMERFVQSRQSKRRQMAKDKTDRVKDAMGTMSVLGGGRGRTITSSLMGPGGTERTGRPSRHVGASSHEFEYIEQLDMISNHTLVKNPSKVMLREYNRPKLPGTIVRTSLRWQFCIRHLGPNSSADKQKKPETNNASSYQAMMMGTYAGAISKTKLRTEADLTPTEGKLVLFEYCEERPPLQLTKAMASKIITYYRGDKSRCPVSAGGGDRPSRRKRQTGNEAALAAEKKAAADGTKGRSDSKVDKPPRLTGPNRETTITDWVGKAPKRSKDDRKNEKENYNILPEGVTEILHQKAQGPFIGEIEDGQSVTGLISNLFVAPLFKQEPESTDFLMILGRNSGASIAGRSESLSVVLRDLPSSMFTVGQTEPRTRVYAPNTQGEKNFTGPFLSYQIAKVLTRAELKEGQGLDFEELGIRTFPKLGSNGMRQRIKHVALYDKNTQIWSAKKIGQDEYPGVDALGKSIAPEGVVAWEAADAAKQRMNDLGIHQLYSGSHATLSVGVTMFYLAGQMNASREISRKVKKLGDMSQSNKAVKSLQAQYYEYAARELDLMSKSLRQRHDVAKFIYEELQLAPWHITGELTDVHIKGDGSGMMKLTGLGDPSGIGEGFSFLREADNKPSKSSGASAMGQTAEMKKITGTSDDLRKLTMKQMGRILKSYGMAQKQVDTLKRWDRVHVIRDLSTKAASDGIGDGLERFARGEKMKLSEQKQIYRERIQVIWKRQIAALSIDIGDGRAGNDEGDVPNEADEAATRAAAQKKKEAAAKDDSDSDSDEDDFAADLEEEMMDQTEANQLVAGQTGGETSLGQLRSATQDQAMSNDARDLAALKRQREEERVAQEGMTSRTPAEDAALGVNGQNRKIIRKRITKTYPDGRSITTFKFIVNPHEVGQIIARLAKEEDEIPKKSYKRPDYMPDEKQIGHAMFSDEDDFEFTVRGGRSTGTKRRGAGRRGRVAGGRGMSRKKDLQFGKLKTKVTKEQRIKKRKREEDELEVYSSIQRRQGTSNRKERGSIRDRRPHVIFANKLESIRSTVESRPSAGPFHKPVNRKLIPRYYEMISHPMDLATIKTKIEKYEYRTVDSLLKDFELVKTNAIKFNGATSMLATEATAIYDTAKNMVDASRAELSHLEQAVDDQMSSQSKKKRTNNRKNTIAAAAPGGDDGLLAGISADLDLDFELSDDSD